MFRLLAKLFLLCFCFTQAAVAAPKAKLVAENLGLIWGMTFIDDARLLFTQRTGEAGVFNLMTQQVTWLQGLPKVHSVGQGGLLDVQKSPDFKQTGWVYFTYAKETDFSSVTVLARAALKHNQLINWQDLLITQSETFSNIHYGSRIAFDEKGHVFMSVGDRGNRSLAQKLDSHAGKILRLNLDGSVPASNPFIKVKNALPEIWSYGHRNPQGLVFDRLKQRLWSHEHGPKGGDEINLIQKGKNYGWPVVSQGREYFSGAPVGIKHQAGMQEPAKVYIPSIAPSGMVLKDQTLWLGALVLRHLNAVSLNAKGQVVEEQRLFKGLKQRIRSVALDLNGQLYMATDQGNIYRVLDE